MLSEAIVLLLLVACGAAMEEAPSATATVSAYALCTRICIAIGELLLGRQQHQRAFPLVQALYAKSGTNTVC